MPAIRELDVGQIRDVVAKLCREATHILPDDVVGALKRAREREESPLAQQVLGEILENVALAAREMLPLCQDTGTTVVFMDLGQDVHLTGGDLYAAINQGVGQGYTENYLRASMVQDPIFSRVNTKDNTPAVVHLELVPGDKVNIKVVPKGGGCENMSRYTNLLPGAGKEGVTDFVLRAVEESSGNPCPPVIVGVGVGGTAEYAMALAKKAITRRIGQRSPETQVAALEEELLEKVNALGIGPQAVGGRNTALDVFIETFPTHITSLHVAVNLQCHSARSKEAVV